MKKNEFIKEIARRHLSTHKHAEEMLNSLIATIQDELKTDAMESKVPGLGTFKLVTRAARSGRNPHTGEAMEIPEKMVLKFKAAKGF